MSATILDSCGAATHGFEHIDGGTGGAWEIVDGPDGIKRYHSLRPPGGAFTLRDGVGTIGRCNFWWRFVSSSGPLGALLNIVQFGNMFWIMIENRDNFIELRRGGDYANVDTGGTNIKSALARISVAWDFTSFTVNEVRVWCNGTLNCSVTNGNFDGGQTDDDTNLSYAWFGDSSNNPAWDGYFERGIYFDDDNSLTDPGAIWVTPKLPITVNANNFDTPVGSGAVYERPISVANGMQQAAASAVQQNYTVQGEKYGDIDVSGETLIAHTGWVYGKRGA